MDPFLLKEVASFSGGIYSNSAGMRVGLLQNIKCHPIFSNEAIWQNFGKKIFEKIAKEEGYNQYDKFDKKTVTKNLIESDLTFLKTVEINPFVTNLIKELEGPVNSSSDIDINSSSKSLSVKSELNISQKDSENFDFLY